MKKLIIIVCTVICLIGVFILTYNKDIRSEKVDNSNNISEDKFLGIIKEENDTEIEYNITKLDLYSKLFLDETKKEYVYINYANDNKIAFSLEQDYNQYGRSKTAKIGIYDLEKDTIEYVKSFDEITFVQDIVIDNFGDIVYSYYDEDDHWYIKKANKDDDILIDEGYGFMYNPRLAKNDDEILYLYEKINKVDETVEYKYGVNKIDSESNYTELVYNIEKSKDIDNINFNNQLINDTLYCLKDECAYLAGDGEKAFFNTYNFKTNETKKIDVPGRIYNIIPLENSFFMSLEDRETNIPKLMILSLSDNKITIIEESSKPYYRMESNGRNLVMAIDQNFNVYIFKVDGDKVYSKEIKVDEHLNEPVEFKTISDNEFLIHYSDDDNHEENALYLLSIK